MTAPWLLGFAERPAAVVNHIAFAMAFAPLTLMITALRPAAAVCLAGGAWLAVSPWLLGYASTGPAGWGADLVIGGALMWMSCRGIGVTSGGQGAAALGGGPDRAEPSAGRNG